MTIQAVLFGGDSPEEVFKVPDNVRIGVFLDQQRGGSVLNKQRKQTVADPAAGDPALHFLSNFVEALAASLNGNAVLRLLQSGLLDGDRLGQVPGLIHVAAPADSDVISEQLQRDDFQDRQQ